MLWEAQTLRTCRPIVILGHVEAQSYTVQYKRVPLTDGTCSVFPAEFVRTSLAGQTRYGTAGRNIFVDLAL